MTQSKAMLVAVAAYFLWVVYDTTIKLGQQAPVSPYLIMVIVGSVSAACITAFSFLTNTTARLRPTRLREQSFTAIFATGTSLANMIALKHVPLTLFYVVFFTSPLIIAILSAFLKHETLSPLKIMCLVAGFFGTVLAIGMPSGYGSTVGYIAIFFGVMCFSLRAISIRQMAKTVAAESTLLLCNIFIAIAGIIGVLLHPGAGIVDVKALPIFFASGLFSAIGSILYFRALQNTASTNIAQLHYTQIVFGAVFGYLLWNEVPSLNFIVGAIVIIASGVLIAAQVKKTELNG